MTNQRKRSPFLSQLINTEIPNGVNYCVVLNQAIYILIQLNTIHFSPSCIGEGNGTPLQYSCLENSRDGGAWWAAVHEVAKSWVQPSNFTFTFHFHVLEKEMATHSSVLAWRIPGTEEPGGLPSMGSHRVGHDWNDLAAAAAAINILPNSYSVQSTVLPCRGYRDE